MFSGLLQNKKLRFGELNNPAQAPLAEGGAGQGANSGPAELSAGHSALLPVSISCPEDGKASCPGGRPRWAGWICFQMFGGHNKCAERDTGTDVSKALESEMLPFSSRSHRKQDRTAGHWLVKGLSVPGLTAQSCLLLPCDALCQTPGRQHAASQGRSARILGISAEASEKLATPTFPSQLDPSS